MLHARGRHTCRYAQRLPECLVDGCDHPSQRHRFCQDPFADPDAQPPLEPGYWELSARINPGQYVESIANMFGGGSRRSWRSERPTDWFEVSIEGRQQASIRVIVSDKGGVITGIVQTEGKPVPGIPVFMWPVAEQARRSLRGQLQTLSDVNGQFNFDSLPPGDYRVVATFDLNEADEESMGLARAVTVHVDASQTANAPLTPWVAP